MGIEEMINEYKKQIENNMKYIKGEWACEAYRISGMKIAVDVLRKVVKDLQLLKSSLPTQQDKVEVPEFPRHIIDYLKWCERNNKTLLEVIGGARCYDADYAFWTEEEKRKIAVAYATGDYTVEKEQLYEVVFYEDESDRWLLMQLGENSYEIVPESGNDGYRTQWFTEEKIKAINEKYWVFRHPVDEQCQSIAVPVEEEEK